MPKVSAADEKGEPGASLLATSGMTIESSGPLSRIMTTTDLNCAVSHVDDTSPEFYGDTACATLVALDDCAAGR